VVAPLTCPISAAAVMGGDDKRKGAVEEGAEVEREDCEEGEEEDRSRSPSPPILSSLDLLSID